MTSGKMKAFQYRWNVKIASTASAGRESGTMMWRYTCHSDAPSTRAACSSSVGNVWMNCFMRKTPKTSARPGRMTPGYVSSRPSARRMKKTGISVTCAGTVSVLTMSQNMTSFPGKRRFAKA